jgi:cytochrome c
MKSVLISALVAAGLVASAPAFANKDLATKSGCMACHAVDKKLVGPAYQEVAKKYKAADEAMLVSRSRPAARASGARSRCRRTPRCRTRMKTLVTWILGGAK